MTRILTLATCLTCLAIGTASAQDTPATPAPAAPGGALAVGEAAQPDTPRGPEIYTRETHGDFSLRCVRTPEDQPDPCQLYQRLTDSQGNAVSEVNFFAVDDNAQGIAGGATIVTPLQTLLTAQLMLSVDGGQPKRYPFAFCDPQGCYARMGFTAEEMAQFRAGATATIAVRPALAPDQLVETTLSLSGFTAGMAALEAAAAE